MRPCAVGGVPEPVKRRVRFVFTSRTAHDRPPVVDLARALGAQPRTERRSETLGRRWRRARDGGREFVPWDLGTIKFGCACTHNRNLISKYLMQNGGQLEEQQREALVVACARCAAAVGASLADASVQSLARGFESAARRGAKEIGCDAESDVAIAVEFLSCTAEEVPLDKAQAWFTARLGLLLELLQPSCRLSEEAGAFLPLLARGFDKIEQNFRADAPRREHAQAVARAAKEEAESLALARIAEEQHRAAQEQRRSAPAVVQPIIGASVGIPSNWVRSSDFEGEWTDASLHEEVLAAKTHVRPGFPTFRVHRAGSLFTFQCVLRWGGDTLAAKLMSAAERSPRAAFDAVMRVFRTCPDEPLKPETPWLWQVRDALDARFPKTAPRATALEMANTVEIGPPRYVCKVTFFEPAQQQVHRSSTPRQSVTAAFEEALARCLEFATACQATAPTKRTRLERMADEGLAKGTLEYSSSPIGKQLCRLRWQSLDGTTLAVESVLAENREDAFASALKLAVEREESREVDWKAAVRAALVQRGVALEAVTVRFAEAQSVGSAKRYICKVSWGVRDAFLHETQPCATMRAAVLSAAQGVESTLARLKSAQNLTRITTRAVQASSGHTPQPKQSQAEIREIMRLFEGMRPRWMEERQRLLAKADRSVAESTRLRDLSAYLAFLDPVRRGELEVRRADQVFGHMMQEATTVASEDCGKINTLDDLNFLRAITAGKATKAGAPLMLTAEFDELCASKGKKPEAVVSHLVDRNLVNRRGVDQLTIAEAGFRLLVKYVGPRSGFAVGPLSDTATAKLAHLKSTLT